MEVSRRPPAAGSRFALARLRSRAASLGASRARPSQRGAEGHDRGRHSWGPEEHQLHRESGLQPGSGREQRRAENDLRFRLCQRCDAGWRSFRAYRNAQGQRRKPDVDLRRGRAAVVERFRTPHARQRRGVHRDGERHAQRLQLQPARGLPDFRDRLLRHLPRGFGRNTRNHGSDCELRREHVQRYGSGRRWLLAPDHGYHELDREPLESDQPAHRRRDAARR